MKKISKKLLSVLLVIAMLVPTGSLMVQISAETEGDGILEFNGHYYKVFNESLTWYEAEDACETMGGHLVTITSQEEQDFVFEISVNSTKKNIWLGGIKEDNKYVWITNEDINAYLNWRPGEPNNTYGQESVIMMYAKKGANVKGYWNDTIPTGEKVYGSSYTLNTFGYLCEWDSIANVPGGLSENAKSYIQQHVDFVNSNTYNNLMTNASFYNALWQYESTDRNFTAYTAWEVLGDVGEIASLNFNNLFVTDNPYDVILADVLSGYVVDNTILNICEKTLEVVFDVDKIANSIIKTLDITDATTLKNTTEAIKSYLSESKKKFIDGVLFSTEEYDFEKKHPGAYETLSSLFPKVKDDKWDDIFGKLKNTSTIIGYINTGSDVVGCFFDAYQKYLIAQTLVESQSEVLGALMVAGYYLPPIAQDLFVEALNDYLDVIDYDSSFSAVCNYALGGSIKNVYNILKEGLKTTVYSGIAKMLGVASGNVNAVVFAYNTTYSLLDYFSGLGEGSALFFLLDSAAMLEDALLTVVQSNANNLKNGLTFEKAKLFDASWSTLQAVEQYTYNGLSKYISSIKKQNTFMFAIKTTVGGFFTKYLAMKELNKKNSDADTAIQVAVMFEGEWKNSNCHNKNSQVSKVVSVKCPTDVYVYDETEKLVLSIVNNKIEVCDIYIAATVDRDEKIFALSDNGKYDIKIVGTDDGSMDYSICDLLNNEITEYTEFEDISLSKDCVYTGVLDNRETDYDLILDYWVCKHPDENHDGICDSCSEDFTKSCSCSCHSNAFMQFLHKILCFLYRIFGMEQYRYCGCGKAHW